MKVRQDDFVSAARKLYERQGLRATTIKDVTDALGVRRTLFYHYFSSKDELNTAVLNAYIDEYLASLTAWKDRQSLSQVDDAILESVRILRSYMFDVSGNSFLRSLASSENAALYLEFTDLVADRLSVFFVDTVVRAYMAVRDLEVKNVYGTFYLLIYGLIGLLRHHPGTSDEQLRDLVMQSLHVAGVKPVT
ncbi:MAG: TetR/AcrR family transcriptional regulator [Eggerthellaceae bacterium]